jgi:hypothetical protein
MTNPNAESAPISNRDKRMFFGFSLVTWENAMVTFLIVAGVSALLAGLATWAVVRIQRVEIAEANARQKEAELKLEELRIKMGPRQIDGEVFKKSLEGKPTPTAPVEIMFPREDGEAFRLAIQLRDVLRYSGWQASEPTPVPPGDVPRLQNQPSVASYGSYGGTGVVVVVRADTQAQFEALRDVNASTPLNALVAALTKTLGSAGSAAAGPEVFHVPAVGVLRVVIGTKS